ncbi:MAG TPA: class I SAM-dependent methyltransferase, partial [Sedimentisphaerales bacterium]|nr:class I SAM-dependent methyltransferase [Sedimentisphaerales bacterium]
DHSDDGSSPYLPCGRGALKQKLFQLQFRAVYWIWKRMICKYSYAYKNNHTKLSFLDVGCGPGNFLSCMQRWFKNADICGLDANQQLLKYAAEHTENVKLSLGSAEKLPFEQKTFDVVSSFHVIEHLQNPDIFLCQANRILKDRGLLLLATPNTKSLAARTMGKRWIGFRYDHISLRSAEQWHDAIVKNGFTILSQGTTFFKGIPVIGDFPLGAPFQLLQTFIGWLPWKSGASYMAVAVKKEK